LSTWNNYKRTTVELFDKGETSDKGESSDMNESLYRFESGGELEVARQD
jgi:hypothetical protein